MGQPISQSVAPQYGQNLPPPLQIAVQLWDSRDFHGGGKAKGMGARFKSIVIGYGFIRARGPNLFPLSHQSEPARSECIRYAVSLASTFTVR
jgi:hypothetical protein